MARKKQNRMALIGSAQKVDSDITCPQFPGLLQEVFQKRPKPKGKKQKSQIDETRTEISYSLSTFAEGETGTCVSKELGTSSSRLVESRRSKKRGKLGSKKSLKDMSGSVYSGATSSSPGSPEESKEPIASHSYLVTLNCPLCCDSDCILNKAAQCPLLRQNEHESINNDFCSFCGTTCRCEDKKKQRLPVSGLVPRDENGIAVTLLKTNGGPIENSYEWANRKRWVVPSYVRWEHTISGWITAPVHENMKAEIGHIKKPHKFKNKRKGKGTPSNFTAAAEVTSNSEDPRTEEAEPEAKLILDGHGFKIFAKGKEKILINYDRKNCKYMGCICTPGVEATNCGCGGWMGSAGKSIVKQHKNFNSKLKKISLVKETSHGMEPFQKELDAKYAREKTKCGNVMVEKPTDSPDNPDKCDDPKQELKKDTSDKKEAHNKVQNDGSGRKVDLIGKDVRNQSRAEFLESSLKEILGNDYKDNGEPKKAAEPENKLIDSYISVPCPLVDELGVAILERNLDICTCMPNC